MKIPKSSAKEYENVLQTVANMYYVYHRTQEEIAAIYGVSRTKVFQLLAEAQNKGIVEVNIDYPEELHASIGARLEEYFPEVRIYAINTKNLRISQTYDAVCTAAADYFNGIISNKTVLAISRGKTMHRMVRLMHPYQMYPGMAVVQLSGMMEQQEPFFEEMDLLRRISEIYGCHYSCFALPYIVNNMELRNQLLSCTIDKEYANRKKKIGITFSSVATLEPWQRVLDQKDFQLISCQKAVASFWGSFLDISGNVVHTEIDNRLIAPTEQEIRGIKKNICVASGGYKARAILAVLRSGLAQEVFIDSNLAIKVLNLISNTAIEL